MIPSLIFFLAALLLAIIYILVLKHHNRQYEKILSALLTELLNEEDKDNE